MGDSGKRVVVTGLRDLGKALKDLDTEAKQLMSNSLKGIAEGVASDVRSRVPHKTGALAASYKARGSVGGAAIAWSGTKAPYAPWIDFGGKVGKDKSVSRPFIKGGRYLYPAIADNMADISDLVADAINDVVTKYGLKVEGTD